MAKGFNRGFGGGGGGGGQSGMMQQMKRLQEQMEQAKMDTEIKKTIIAKTDPSRTGVVMPG